MVANTAVRAKKTIQLLGIKLDQKLSFREHKAGAISRTLNSIPLIQRLAFPGGVSLHRLHHIVTTFLIAILLRGSEIWWARVRQTIDNLTPTYLKFAHIVTNLPIWTRTDKPLVAGNITLLEPLLDSIPRKYALRLLQAPDGHPNKATFSKFPPI